VGTDSENSGGAIKNGLAASTILGNETGSTAIPKSHWHGSHSHEPWLSSSSQVILQPSELQQLLGGESSQQQPLSSWLHSQAEQWQFENEMPNGPNVIASTIATMRSDAAIEQVAFRIN